MKQTIMDKAISKVSKNKINTVRVTRDEMVDMIDKYFIQAAVAQEDYKDIWKVVKRGIILDKFLVSKDGNYELRAESSQGGPNLKRYVWIHDKAENTYYEYNYYFGFYGKFKRIMRKKLAEAQK